MRMSPSDPWRLFTAEQTFGIGGIDFRWKARARIARWLPVTIIAAVHLHRGILSVRLFGVCAAIRILNCLVAFRAELSSHPRVRTRPPRHTLF